MNTLQSLIFPNLEVPIEESMYLRLNERCWAKLADGGVVFEPGGVLSTDTFFNGVSVGAWKRNCDISSVFFKLQGRGAFVFTLGLHRADQSTVWIAEHPLMLSEGVATSVPVQAWPALTDGLLFFRLRALGAAVLEDGRLQTADAPLHPVRLGLVITHFNRQAQVLPAVQRICRDLLDRSDLHDRVTLTVVDNSRNLEPPAHLRINYIPNRNLGGTGGFVRGLLSLMDRGDHTHALFMDDDASCEVDSIARALALLQYARRPRLAVAGALLREMAPWHLVEKGARFDGKVVPLKPGLDMRQLPDLLEAERPGPPPDYGAWWFFAFSLADVRQFPFPFFVRGDDVLFGLDNGFNITTLNGIACLGEDFGSKHGPLTAYLDARYHLVHALLSRHAASRVFWVGSRLFVKALSGYLYSSARAVTLALRHTLEGPAFFRDNLDLQAVRKEIASWSPSEKLEPLNRADIEALGGLKAPRRQRESALRRLGRALTLQGALLPGWLLRDRTTVQPKQFHGRASAVFRYRRVLYQHAATGTAFIAEFDRRRFFSELSDFVAPWWTMFRRLPALQRAYRDGARELTSEAFWRNVYADPVAPVDDPSVGAEAAAAPSPPQGASVAMPARVAETGK